MDVVKICALGGLDENGRDCYVVEINDDILVLDAGTSLPDKTLPGIDFILPNSDYLIKNKTRIKGYIMTHGHDENMGALKYFYHLAPAPIYATYMTAGILKSQAYIHGIKTDFKFVEVKASDTVNIAGHIVHFFQTAHNMAYSSGVAIETDQGNVVYTGDFIVDYNISNPCYIFDLKKLSKIGEKPTLVLLAESKTAHKNGYCSPSHQITHVIENYFDEEKRIFISCFWQNLYRIHEIVALVKKYNKKMYFYDDYTINTMSSYNKYTPIYTNNDVISKEDLLRVRAQDVVVLMLGHDDTLYEEINCLAKGENEDKRLKLGEEDIFISAAIPVPTMEIACTHSIDNLYRTKCKTVWVKNKQVNSMHAKQDDLRLMLTLLKPKYYFPIRGYFVQLMANAKLALATGIGLTHMSVFVVDNGMQIILDGVSRPRLFSLTDHGYQIGAQLVDGRGVTNFGAEMVEERKKLGVDGTVVVAATISKTQKRVIAGPDCQMRGFVYVREAEPLLKTISNIYLDEVNAELKSAHPDFEKAKETICLKAKRFIKRENGREPYILPIIIEND